MIFISFGASASREIFDIIKKNIPARECVKALEKGKYIGKSPYKKESRYLLNGYLYQFTYENSFRVSKQNDVIETLQIKDCIRSNKIY
jgi:hypothetical protein